MIATTLPYRSHGPIGIGQISLIRIVQTIGRDGTVIDDKTIQVPIQVVIKKTYLCCVSRVIQTILCRGLGESEIVVVDEQLVFSQRWIVHAPCIANINVEPSIVIDIRHYHTGTPLLFIAETCFVRNIFELEISFVKIKLITALVGGKKNVSKAVIVDIANRHSTAVVKISVVKNIQLFCVMHRVAETNDCIVH